MFRKWILVLAVSGFIFPASAAELDDLTIPGVKAAERIAPSCTLSNGEERTLQLITENNHYTGFRLAEPDWEFTVFGNAIKRLEVKYPDTWTHTELARFGLTQHTNLQWKWTSPPGNPPSTSLNGRLNSSWSSCTFNTQAQQDATIECSGNPSNIGMSDDPI